MSKDTIVRTAKTFVQAFGGVFIPGLCIVLNQLSTGGFPDDFNPWFWTTIAPMVCASLSAGICAAWNYYLELKKKKQEAQE